MKKLFKTIICLALALVMCFGLTACGEFSGSFKTIASADEVNAAFAKVSSNIGKVDTESGYQIKATFEGALEDEFSIGELSFSIKGDINTSVSGKVSIKDGVKSSLESKTTVSGISNPLPNTTINFNYVSDVATYADDVAMYTNSVTNMNGIEEKSKTKVNFDTDVQSVIGSFMMIVSENVEGVSFFSFTGAQLKTEGVLVYIDSSGKGTKIKFEFDDTNKGNRSVFGKGTAIYSFGANNLLRGYWMDYELQGLKIFVELKPYNGSVKLPSDLDTYEG